MGLPEVVQDVLSSTFAPWTESPEGGHAHDYKTSSVVKWFHGFPRYTVSTEKHCFCTL